MTIRQITVLSVATILVAFSIGCATIIKEPMTYKEFKIQNDQLEGAHFAIKDVYFIGFNMTTKTYANGEFCYMMAISETPPDAKDTAQVMSNATQFIGAGGGGVFIPINNKPLLTQVTDFKPGDKLSKIKGIGSYPYMKISALAPAMKFPNATVALVAQEIVK